MSTKDYVAIAQVLRAEMAVNRDRPEHQVTVQSIARSLADVFKRDNDRFNREIFYTACGLTEEGYRS